MQINRKELCERMPYLIPRNVWTGEVVNDYDYSYINGEYDLPEGWFKLFLQMCEDIRQPLIDDNYIDKFRFSQIKEKYNTMRCYNFGCSNEVHDIIRKYEHISSYVCQACGKPATKETCGWIASYCDECIPEGYKYVDIPEFNGVLHLHGWDSINGEYNRDLDCSDEWRRLYAK